MNKKSPVRRSDHVITFRKWGRTGYAVFQSLHRLVRIGFLSISYLLFAIPANAQKNMMTAPHDSLSLMKDVEIDEVVVSAQRAPVTFSQVARTVSVIEKDEIQHLPVQSLQDLLEYALNVDVRQRGGLGVQADVSIRGGTFDQTLILLNGINLNDPQTGHHNLNLPVSLDAIERIEILEGPASRVYGLNAFSGAINFITGTSNTSNLKARLSGGYYGFYDAGVSGNLVTGKLINFVSFDHSASDGYIKNTDFKLTDAYYQGKLTTSSAIFEIQIGNSDRAFGANSFYTPVYPDQYEKVNTTFSSLKMVTGKIIHFTPAIYWRRNKDRFELFRFPDLAPSWYKDHNYHLTDVYGSNLNTWFATALGKTDFGADFRSENIWSTVLGQPLSTPIPIPGESGKEFRFADSRTNFSLYIEHSVYWNRFSLSGGLMANWNSHLGRYWNFYPGLDCSWNIIKQLKWYFSLNRSLRMPTFTDLYYSSPTNIGNPSLRPEEATAIESGLKYNNSWIISHFAYFRRWGKNMIDWIKEPTESVWQAANLTDLNTDGIEISAKISTEKIFSKGIFIKSFNFAYSKLSQGKESGTYSSKYVLDYLKNKIDFGITHSIFKGVGANWQISYQDRNGTYTKWHGTSYGEETSYIPVWLVDGRLFWQKRGTCIYIEGSNLLNKSYIDYANVEQPGVWFKVGLILQLNL
jgi:vitamin B12 transporter